MLGISKYMVKNRAQSLTQPDKEALWSMPMAQLMQNLKTSTEGISTTQAQQQRAIMGENRLIHKSRQTAILLFISQFKSPISLLLLLSVALSFFLHDATDAAIILVIIAVSSLLSFFQEHNAANALDKLLAVVKSTSIVLRDGKQVDLPMEEIVPGDIILITAGAKIPADCRILESRDLFVNEASLTGETFPVEKRAGDLPAKSNVSESYNALFLGTFVVSGTAKVLVIHTGRNTQFAAISDRLQLRPPETDFERGVRRFSQFLIELTLILVIAIFAINVFFHRPVLEAFMFSLALAVGLTPQLLPAVISVNLAHGAKKMAGQHVIVRRLPAIENFGSMDVLCCDKTGTLTEGEVRIQTASDMRGAFSEKVLLYAYLNAFFQAGFKNPIDEAIRQNRVFDVTAYSKRDEIPYDFIRKRLSVSVFCNGQQTLITKGAVDNIISICAQAEDSGRIVPLGEVKDKLLAFFEKQSQSGLRCLAICYRNVAENVALVPSEEKDMVFLGFIVLYDPPKADIVETVKSLKALGVSLKMVTGDNRFVAGEVGRRVLMGEPRVLTGAAMRLLSDEALIQQSSLTDIFAEVEPNQKERIVLALKKAGHVTGYMGDGINDASALHAADVGISVDGAVDVAKEASDIVLMKRDLKVLASGIRIGRKTFANTLKYVFMATGANFGNMFSMAGASLFLPFLPLLPKQILLINLLTDFPEMTIATDTVDEELIATPQRWNLKMIRNFMLVFGLLSSFFDFLTFGFLHVFLKSDTGQFRTGWFLESVISAAFVVLVVRSRRRLGSSKPGKLLLLATSVVVAVTLYLPSSPLAKLLGLAPIPCVALIGLGCIVALFVISAELVKRQFYKNSMSH